MHDVPRVQEKRDSFGRDRDRLGQRDDDIVYGLAAVNGDRLSSENNATARQRRHSRDFTMERCSGSSGAGAPV
jgi:hypothetical protein